MRTGGAILGYLSRLPGVAIETSFTVTSGGQPAGGRTAAIAVLKHSHRPGVVRRWRALSHFAV